MLQRIIDLLRHPKILGKFCVIGVDYLLFRLRHRFFPRLKDADPRRTVLIVNLTEWIAQVKMDAMVGVAMRLKGCTPVVLTWKTSKWAHLYFRAFGITEFIFFDDFLTETESVVDQRVLQGLLSRELTFRELFDFRYENVNVGRHVLSTVLRRIRHGTVEFRDPRVKELLQEILPYSMNTALAAKKLFERLRPEAVLFLEKGYTPYGEIFDAALEQNLNIVNYNHAHRIDAPLLKRYGAHNRFQHPHSLSEKSWKIAKLLAWSDREESLIVSILERWYRAGTWCNNRFLKNQVMKTPAEVQSQLALDPRKKTAVIYSHVLWDATFFYGETLFPDYEQWLIATVKAACENDKVNWVIKLHPDNAWKMKSLGDAGDPRDVVALAANIGRLPDHIRVVSPLTDISTYSLYQCTDYCVTVRGTVGLEAPCFGIPVITAGTGRYSGLGFTNDSVTPEEYLEKIRTIHTIPTLTKEEKTLARRHAYTLLLLRPFLFTSFEEFILKRSIGSALDHNVKIRPHSLDALRNAKDLEEFGQWVLESEDEDYLRNTPLL